MSDRGHTTNAVPLDDDVEVPAPGEDPEPLASELSEEDPSKNHVAAERE